MSADIPGRAIATIRSGRASRGGRWTVTTSYDLLKAEIAARCPSLSPRLRQVAEFALTHPDDMALETIAVIAERAKVP
ncbi:hypothetical protein L9G16_19990, partial [Shewanella sp. A25]|nr:hypothetical protein [Shewanella shenzhenensis]